MESKIDMKKYIVWENKSNICWLDASMALIAHNQIMKKCLSVGIGLDSRISRIIKAYDDAISILNSSDKNINQRISLAKEKLNTVQESTLRYLQPRLKYKTGEPDSAFCSLYNLLIQDNALRQIFDITWISVRKCLKCDRNAESRKTKPVITLSKVGIFQPENPTSLYQCSCNRSDQKIYLKYVNLPPCMIFHFENGAGTGKRPPLRFITHEREYQLTGIVTLEKSQDSTINHFITWIRDPSVGKWLDCNDLNIDVISFSSDFPDINLEDVYIYVFESYDGLGTIKNEVASVETSQEHIPFIDISEESEVSDGSNSQNNVTVADKDVKMGPSEPNPLLQDFNSVEPNKGKSMSLDNFTSSSTAKIPQADFIQNVKFAGKKNHAENLEKWGESANPNIKKVSKLNSEINKASLNSVVSNNKNAVDVDFQKKANEQSDIVCCNEVNNSKMCEHNEQNSDSGCITKYGPTSEGSRICSTIDNNGNSPKNDEIRSKTSLCDSVVKSKTILYGLTENERSLVPTETCLEKNYMQNKVPLPNLNSHILGNSIVKQENLNSVETEDISAKLSAEKENAREKHNNDKKLVLDSSSEQQIHAENSVSNAIPSMSGTSYVKLSLRRRYSSVQLNKNERIIRNLDAKEIFYNNAINASNCSTYNEETEESKPAINDYVPYETPMKKPRVSVESKNVLNTKEEADDLKAEAKLLNTVCGSSSQVEIKPLDLKSHQLSEENTKPEQRMCIYEGEKSSTYSSERTFLKGFQQDLLSHEASCECENFDQWKDKVSTTVDFVLSYICNLGVMSDNLKHH